VSRQSLDPRCTHLRSMALPGRTGGRAQALLESSGRRSPQVRSIFQGFGADAYPELWRST